MKRFISHTTLFFIIPLLLLAGTYEILLRNIPNEYSIKKTYMDEHASEIETLILGSSHSYRGINPTYFTTHAFNLAMVSQPLYYDYRLFEKYKEKMPNLKNVIISISVFSLYNGQMDDMEESWRRKNYDIYYGLSSSNSLKTKFELFNTEYKIGLDRILDFYWKKNLKIDCDELGWGEKIQENTSEINFDELGSAAAKRHERDINNNEIQQKLKDNLTHIKSLITWCKNKNIKVILFLPPALEEYRKHLQNEQLKATISTTQSLTNDFDNCFYYNLLEDSNYNKNDFMDADHLNANGAKKLSLFLNHKIEEQH